MTHPSPIRTVPRHAYAGPSSDARTEQPGKPSVAVVTARLAAKGLLAPPGRTRDTHPPPLKRAEIAEIRRLRHTHTLGEIGAKFGRHPSTIAAVCQGVPADFRGKRRERTRG